MRIVKGDTIKVLYGKYAGKTGVVTAVLTKKKQVVVDGINKAKRHIKGNGKSKVSGIVEISKPMPLSKVQLVDSTGKATRVKYEIKDGKKLRVSVKTGKPFESIVKKTVAKKAELKTETKEKSAETKKKLKTTDKKVVEKKKTK